MPDYLSDCAPPYGVVDRAMHDGGLDTDEVAWLENRLWCFLKLLALEGSRPTETSSLPTAHLLMDSRPRDCSTAEVLIWVTSYHTTEHMITIETLIFQKYAMRRIAQKLRHQFKRLPTK